MEKLKKILALFVQFPPLGLILVALLLIMIVPSVIMKNEKIHQKQKVNPLAYRWIPLLFLVLLGAWLGMFDR